MKSSKLSVLEKVGFGAGDAAVNVVISAMFLLITKFYTDVMLLDPKDLVMLFIVVRFIDAVTDPAMGLLTDRFSTRWGRYRPYFVVLAIPFAISVFLTFTTPALGYDGKLIWAYATYTLVTLVFTAVTIPYISVLGVMTGDPKDRLSANGYRLFFAKIAAFLVTIAVPKLAQVWPELAAKMGLGRGLQGYQAAMGLMGAVGGLLFLFCFFTVKERISQPDDKRPFFQQAFTQIGHLLRNDQWLILCAVCVVGTIGYTVRLAVAAYYAVYYLGGGAGTEGGFMATGVIAAVLAMVASTWITKRYCKLKLFRWTQIAVAPLGVLMYFVVQPGDVLLGFVLFFVLSFIIDLHAPIFWSAIPEAVDYGEKKTGHRVAGLSYGGMTFWQKAGMGLGGALVAWLLSSFGYVPNQPQTEFSLMGIALMLSVIPSVFHVAMGLLMLNYRITDEYYVNMMKTEAPRSPVATGFVSEAPPA